MPAFTRTCGTVFALLTLASFASASPLYNLTGDVDLSDLVERATPPGVQLKILAVGDSITAGLGSTTGNSYRLNLKFFLQGNRYGTVDFIGREELGSNNPDNQHEGYAAQRTDQIRQKLKTPNERRPDLPNPMSQQPNLVLIHAGTNDMLKEGPGFPYSEAPQRLEKLINYITCRNPLAVVIVAQVVQNNYQNDAALSERTRKYNEAVNVLTYRKRVNGEKVWMADMSVIPMGDENFMDRVHPNDNGYYKMAQIWYNVINSIGTNEWKASNPNDWVGRDVWCNNLGYD